MVKFEQITTAAVPSYVSGLRLTDAGSEHVAFVVANSGQDPQQSSALSVDQLIQVILSFNVPYFQNVDVDQKFPESCSIGS